ncbi:Hybrid signal transduction histidine kinase B [Fusarium oxysporum f. sp. conglutinans]|nr:Hybrid signal transduction histidine kinase B [Fusarium oxysporum f. sp. conglutinans]
MVKAEPIASEGPREWEMLKYASSFTTSTITGDAPCFDAILNALSQLAAFRLQARRAIISFFDRKYQHIVAEATQSSPIGPCPDRMRDRLWPSGINPRGDSICEHVLQFRNTKHVSLDHDVGLEVSVIPDLAEDAHSPSGSCVQGLPHHRFYCGIPIQTPRGFNIGVLSVFDDSPRPGGLDQASIQLLRDLSKTIMSYLETRRATENFIRSERMVNGLSHLVRGNDNATNDVSSSRQRDSRTRGFQQNDSSSNHVSGSHIMKTSASLQDSSECSNGATNKLPLPFSKPAALASLSPATHLQTDTSHFVDPQKVEFASMLSKAADIVCNSLKVEGALFLDAGVNSIGAPMDHENKSLHSVNDSASSSEDSSADHVSDPQNKRPCTILALSTTDQAILDLVQPGLQISLNQKTLKRLISRYPNGKVFSFEESGSLYSGESSSGEEIDPRLPDTLTAKTAADHKPTSSRKDEARPVAELFAGARSVALVPLWDPSRSRFYACGLVWSKTAARILTPEADLPYLKALGIVTMAEINRIDMTLANKAKADLLGTLSHELRSPLHGILAGAELLAGTSLDLFQQEVVHALEISGKTLLDTIDHLLVFSKVNTLSRAFKSQKEHRRRRSPFRAGKQDEESRASTGPEMQSLCSDVALDRLAEEVIETVTIGHSFHYAVMPQGPRWLPPDADLVGKVQITVDIDHRKPWLFRTAPGAIRRILMNILGNALKYTSQGHVKISLKQEKGTSHKGPRKSATVVLTVSDTGKGIGDEFLHYKLFVPFSQEDSLAVGTGLGLSIVKQIVTSLGGSIGVRSHVGKGTTMSVSLPLAYADPGTDNTGKTEREEESLGFDGSILDSIRVAAVGFTRVPCAAAEVNSVAQLPLESLPLKWFNINLWEAEKSDPAAPGPDIIIYSEAAFSKLDENAINGHLLPGVVICHNAGTTVKLDTMYRESGTKSVFEFIHQPNTPRKFGRILGYALNRWKQLQTTPTLSDTEGSSNNTDESPLPVSSADSNRSWNWTTREQSSESASSADSQPDQQTNSSSNPNGPIKSEDQGPQSKQTRGSSLDNSATEEGSVQPHSEFLLVDDNSINLKILSAYMKRLRINYRTAVNGFEALKTFQLNPERFCCVLMDINMPIMDGLEATRLIRKFERENHLKPVTIIAITGLATDGARDEAFASGLDVFLTRPVSLGQLVPVLNERGVNEAKVRIEV